MFVNLKDNFASQESHSLSHICWEIRRWKSVFRKTTQPSAYTTSLTELSHPLFTCSCQHALACNDFTCFNTFSFLLKERKKQCSGYSHISVAYVLCKRLVTSPRLDLHFPPKDSWRSVIEILLDSWSLPPGLFFISFCKFFQNGEWKNPGGMCPDLAGGGNKECTLTKNIGIGRFKKSFVSSGKTSFGLCSKA